MILITILQDKHGTEEDNFWCALCKGGGTQTADRVGTDTRKPSDEEADGGKGNPFDSKGGCDKQHDGAVEGRSKEEKWGTRSGTCLPLQEDDGGHGEYEEDPYEEGWADAVKQT